MERDAIIFSDPDFDSSENTVRIQGHMMGSVGHQGKIRIYKDSHKVVLLMEKSKLSLVYYHWLGSDFEVHIPVSGKDQIF